MDTIIEELRAVVGGASVLSAADELLVYECDGLPQHKYRPRAVVFPSSTEETSEVMRLLARAAVPFTPRGAGTGLSGGALSLNQGVVIELARMRRILKIDEANRIAVVQPGVVNSHVSRAVAHLGLHYVPDPSSQPTCTIGGNIAENAGGIHCLKYGTTTDHVLGVRVVLAGGEVVDLGGGGTEQPGYDLLGAFVGSEGTFGITTEATLRLVPIPPAIRTMLAEFAEVNDASHAVSAIIAAGVMPAALEMMDHEIIRAVEASVFAAGLPLDAGAALLIELDGLEVGIDDEAERVKSICLQHGARDCRLARDENERKKLWAARKGAFGAIGRIAPDSMIQDAVVPRSRLPEVLDGVFRIAAKYHLRIANVFHAGDGNLHPLICFDSRSVEEVRNVKEAGRELMETCVRAGGSITGEHGVGFDKRELLSLIFSEADMETMLQVRAAFDPTGLCNPGKIIPMLRGCGEARAIASPGNGARDLPGPRASRPQSSNQQPAAGSGVSDLLGPRASRPQSSNQQPAAGSGVSDLLGPRASRPQLSSPLTFDPNKSGQQPGGRDARGPSKSLASVGGAKLLANLIGEENICASSHLPSNPLLVTPGSIAEVCEVMKLAASEGWMVMPAGAMTWPDAGQPARRVDIIVSTGRLNRIIDHEPADLVAVTEAGVSLKNFNDALMQKGQWLPLDPPNDGRATIGGVVATGLAGAQQFGYGPPRKHVIGMKVVRADGSLIKVGGRVVKNVAGYDLCKLFTGSYGTLGIIVEVNFKLRPLPFATRTIMSWGPRESLLSGAQRIINSPLFPVAVELLSRPLAYEAEWSEEEDSCLLLRFAGNGVIKQAARAIELLQREDRRGPAPPEEGDSAIWESLATLPTRFHEDLVWRVGLLPTEVPTFLAKLEQAYDSNGALAPMWQASIADGRIRVMERLPRNGNKSGEAEHKMITRLESFRNLAINLGGTLIIEYAPAEIRDRMNTSETLNGAYGIMQKIKEQLDPDRIFPSLSAY